MDRDQGEIFISGNVVHWKLRNFVDDYVRQGMKSSSCFIFMNQMWYFTVLPIEDCREWLQLMLFNCSDCDGSLRVRLGVIGPNEEEIASSIAIWNKFYGVFEAERLIRTAFFKSQMDLIAPGNTFHAFCEIPEYATAPEAAEIGIKKLQNDFKGLLLSGTCSDVTLLVRGKKFKAHRNILTARSPVFSAMLAHDMKEKTTGIVRIDDGDPEVFPEFLHYLYTGSLKNPTPENVLNLYTLADKYLVDDLKAVCKKYVSYKYK